MCSSSTKRLRFKKDTRTTPLRASKNWRSSLKKVSSLLVNNNMMLIFLSSLTRILVDYNNCRTYAFTITDKYARMVRYVINLLLV